MEDFFQTMSDFYVKKHFPNDSVFQGVKKTMTRRGIVGIITLGFFFLFGAGGLFVSVRTLLEIIAEGDSEMQTVGMVVCGFFALITLGMGAVLFFVTKELRKTHRDYIAGSAKQSKLSEQEIEEFERQAVQPDCYILKLTSGLDRALSNATNKDGLLTRDYIYLADPAQTVLRVADLRACCLEMYSYMITAGTKHPKRIDNLAIRLLGANGVTVLSDTDRKAGEALIKMLLERNPAIDTNGGNVLAEGAFDSYSKQLLATH